MHHLGLAHSPFQRQILSPTSNTFSFSSPSSPSTNQDTGDRTQDYKDVLLERLNDLVMRLAGDEDLGDEAVTAIHAEVDRIEKHIREQRRRPRLDEVRVREEESYWGGSAGTPSPLHQSPLGPSALSPNRVVRGRGRVNSGLGLGLGSSPRQSRDLDLRRREREIEREGKQKRDMSPSQAAELAKAAEELAEQLGATVAELLARKEESDHIHDLLVTRASQATERILLLEYRIAEMEDDFSANQSELKFLRIQLQALEAQCSPYIPQNDDEELSESIMNWKIDWEDINRRSRARRRKSGIVVPPELSRMASEEIPLRREFRVMNVGAGNGDGGEDGDGDEGSIF